MTSSNTITSKGRDQTLTVIDGNVYTTIKIGKQIWTVENLKATKFNDGTAIPLVTDSETWSSYAHNKNLHIVGTITIGAKMRGMVPCTTGMQ